MEKAASNLNRDFWWGPTASSTALRVRAKVAGRIRTFFGDRHVLEVDTPILLNGAIPDHHLDYFETRYVGPGAAQGRKMLLHTSPEMSMKRLLAAGSGPIFQICKVFRNGEAGEWHNPEFSMLEWYRPGFTYFELMDEVSDLLGTILQTRPAERLTYHEVFYKWASVDVYGSSIAELKACAGDHGIAVSHMLADGTKEQWLDILFTHLVQSKLGHERPLFVYDYPAEQALLARLKSGSAKHAARFELFINGVELANGYEELDDHKLLVQRLGYEMEKRKSRAAEPVAVSEAFLAAMAADFPFCSGVAMGFDRLVMLATGASHIADVLCFPVETA